MHITSFADHTPVLFTDPGYPDVHGVVVKMSYHFFLVANKHVYFFDPESDLLEAPAVEDDSKFLPSHGWRVDPQPPK